MIWKKTNLFDHLGHYVFLDEYGYCELSLKDIIIDKLSYSNFYRFNERIDKYERIRIDNTNDFSNWIKDLFDSKIGKNKQENSGYYGYREDILPKENISEIEIKSIKFVLRVSYCTSLENRNNQNADEEVIIHKPSDLKKYECWYCDYGGSSIFTMAYLSDIKVDDSLYLVGTGKVRVEKVYDFPSKDNIVCDVVDGEGKKQSLNPEANIYYLPYEKVINEYKELNHSLNELKLSPYVVFSNDNSNRIYNIYWNKVDDASCYCVSLYKIINLKNKRNVLHLADYEVDRNTYYLTIDKLVGADFVIKVRAEDRSGKIIAETRGISQHEPQYFGEKWQVE